MPEIKKVEIETTETPAQAPPSDRTIDMAVEYGRMTKAFEANQAELSEVKTGLARACDLISNQNEVIQSLRSQTANAQTQAETAQETAAIVAAEIAEQESDEGDALPVTPAMETHVQIDQIPVTAKRPWYKSLIYGNR